MKKNWLPLVIVGGLALWWWQGRKVATREGIQPTGTVPPYMIGAVPSGTPIQGDSVLLRNKYTHITTWINIDSVPMFLAGDWIYG